MVSGSTATLKSSNSATLLINTFRVRNLLETYEDSVSFYAPDICFADARRYIPSISEKRRNDPGPGILVLNHLSRLVEVVDRTLYEEFEASLASP